jgi:hypothetical protein
VHVTEMRVQAAALREGLAADVAREGLLARVSPAVRVQVAAVCEGLVAHVARAGPRATSWRVAFGPVCRSRGRGRGRSRGREVQIRNCRVAPVVQAPFLTSIARIPPKTTFLDITMVRME